MTREREGAEAGRKVACGACGAEGTGTFCARCGTKLLRNGAAPRCQACGGELAPEALFCTECGEPVAPRRRKTFRAYLPWVFSALALIAFSAAIAILVQDQSGPRGPDGLITGGLPEPSREAAEVIPAPGAGTGPADGAMPSAADITAMSPREAADRLFDRTMREQETGDTEQARFFAEMALQAYDRVPPSELDSDARFHRGLLHLVLGDPGGARTEAETILGAESRNLFGLVLAARAAEARGDMEAVRQWQVRLREAVETGETPDRPPYTPHRTFLEREAERAGAGVR